MHVASANPERVQPHIFEKAYWGSEKIARITNLAIGILILGTAALLIGLISAKIIATAAVWATPFMISFGAIIIFLAAQKHYDDPKKLAEMKDKARNNDFLSIMTSHSAQTVTEYIFNEPGTDLSLEALQEKCKAHYRKADLCWFIGSQIKNFGKYNIAPQAWVDYALQEKAALNSEMELNRDNESQIHRKYLGRTEMIQKGPSCFDCLNIAQFMREMRATTRERQQAQQASYDQELAVEKTRHELEVQTIEKRYKQNAPALLN
ncbi:MAG: hypothetical protein JSS32_07780 [Verrucomicrobia bacterium]|nr:hypothetical protein [Verrucomicrobiota bacterium]